MEIYAHRGNLRGPEPQRENAPDFIDAAIGAGFGIECDLRVIDGRYWLGHDEAQYETSITWLVQRRNRLLVHLKNFDALRGAWGELHYFCHASDPFTITNRGTVWIHDLDLWPDSRCIVPLITLEQVEKYQGRRMGGVCSDYPIAAREKFG